MSISKMANISIQFIIIYLNFLGFKLLCMCACVCVHACSYVSIGTHVSCTCMAVEELSQRPVCIPTCLR